DPAPCPDTPRTPRPGLPGIHGRIFVNTIDDTTTIIDADTLKAWIERHDDVVVIDVRSAAEFESLHIRGSYNVPLPLLSEHTEDVAQRVGRRVVLVCHSGVRAEQARMRLHEV